MSSTQTTFLRTGGALVASTLLLLTAGCSINGDMRFNQIQPFSNNGTATVNNPEIEELLSNRPQLPKQFRLAIFFKSNTSDYYSRKRPRWEVDLHNNEEWSATDKATIEAGAQTWVDAGVASGVFTLSDALVENYDKLELRKAAARMGADALMIVEGTNGFNETLNKNAWFYPFVVPMVAVHGNTVTTAQLAHVTIWDVRNEFLYASFEEQATVEQKAPMMFTNAQAESLVAARAKAAEQIAARLADAQFNGQFKTP